MSEKKTPLLSLRNKNWKTVMVETEKINKSLTNIPMNKIIELKEQIYTRVKLFGHKIGHPLRNMSKNSKSEWEIRLFGLKETPPQKKQANRTIQLEEIMTLLMLVWWFTDLAICVCVCVYT